MVDFNALLGNGGGGSAGSGSGSGSSASGGGVGGFFSDPNNLRLLAGIGSRFGQGQSVGQALGDPTQELIRRQQFQTAVAGQQQREADFRQQLLDALRGGKLLSPTEQNDGFDSATIDGDGNINLKMKNTPQAPAPSLTDKPLEAVRGSGRTTQAFESGDRSFDLSPFF